MPETIKIGGRLHSIATGNIVAGTDEIYDDAKGKKQTDINTETYSLVNEVNEKLDALDPDQQAALDVAEKANNNEAKIGYYVCDTSAATAAKVIANATGYVLSLGGSIKIKMTNANTADDATLNINSTGAKPLYYAGERASTDNTWEAGETVEVYYDGTNFYANNVAGGGVYNSINLFNNAYLNNHIKELYISGIDYSTIYSATLITAHLLSNNTYKNELSVRYNNNGTNTEINLYSKTFATLEEAMADIPNMNGVVHRLGSSNYAVVSVAERVYIVNNVVVNKDVADINNSPILKAYIDSLTTFKDKRALYIKTDGVLGIPSGISEIFTTRVTPGKKYRIVNESQYATNRSVSFTSDFDGQTVIPHDIDGNSYAVSTYSSGTTIRTAPAGAKYMHITLQHAGDMDSTPYVTVFEYDEGLHNDVNELKEDFNELQTEILNIDETIYDGSAFYNGGVWLFANVAVGDNVSAKTPNPIATWAELHDPSNVNKPLFVEAGSTVLLKVYNNNAVNAKAYLLTDANKIVLDIAPVVDGYYEKTIEVEQDGYLYVNTLAANLSSSSVTISKKTNKIDELQTELNELESKVVPSDENPLSIVKETAGYTSIIHRLGVVGASFTNGGENTTSGTCPLSVMREFSWPQNLARLCGSIAYHFGQPGMYCKQWLNDVGGYYTQMAQPEYACDAYVISFASNDANPSKADYGLGTIADVHIGSESENGASFYGYLSQIVARCHSVQPRAYLFLMTYPYDYSQTETKGYNQAMRDIVTAYRNAGYRIYLIDYATYGMTEEQAQNKGMFRGSHYVGTGYQYMTYEICTYIDWIIKHNMEDFKDIAFVQTDAEYVE